MADLVVTPAAVLKGADAKIEHGLLGAAVTAGQTVYRDAADANRFKPSDANAPTALVRSPRGIALNGGAAGQPVAVQYEGRIAMGAAVAVGAIYVQSDTPGGIMPAADLSPGDFVTVLGIGISAAEIDLTIKASGVALP